MADYFTEFAESYLVTPEQAEVALKLYAAINFAYGDFDGVIPDELPGDLDDVEKEHLRVYATLSEDMRTMVEEFGDGFTVAIHEDEGKPYLYVASDEGSSVEPVLQFLSEVLEHTDDHTTWTLTWSAGCSKPRSGAFGGGAAAINLHRVVMQDAWDVADKLAESMKEDA